MSRTAIKPKHIYTYAQEFLATRSHGAANSKGGRPQQYDDALILTIASIQNLHQFSYREALEFCGDFFEDLPVLSTYHYRLEHMPPKIGQGFIEFQGRTVEKDTEFAAPAFQNQCR